MNENNLLKGKSDEWMSWPAQDFIMTMVHEIRTPLMLIKGYTELLADENAKVDHSKAMEAISSAIERINLSLQGMADYARHMKKS